MPDHAFDIADLDFELPESCIAQVPPVAREDARLLVLDRQNGTISDRRITDLPSLLQPGDLLVLNDTQVVKAKFFARRAAGRVVEGLFLGEDQPGRWQVLLRGSSRLRLGETLTAQSASGVAFSLVLHEQHEAGQWTVAVQPIAAAFEVLEIIGETPLPHYIAREDHDPVKARVDLSRYQTIYARVPGAVAAPTAGLHFTQRLLAEIQGRGVEVAWVTLHVGLGTFRPIRSANLAEHRMHAERLEVSHSVVSRVEECRKRGGRVVAVGTTSVRALESAAAGANGAGLKAIVGTTDLFIRPPYGFRVVEALLTNFHLPRSTLLALVMAMGGVEAVKAAYRHAVESGYRFYSYGDAMFVT